MGAPPYDAVLSYHLDDEDLDGGRQGYPSSQRRPHTAVCQRSATGITVMYVRVGPWDVVVWTGCGVYVGGNVICILY